MPNIKLNDPYVNFLLPATDGINYSLDLPSLGKIKVVIFLLDFNLSNWSNICDLIGAIPAPPPINNISKLLSLAKKSPNGP